MTLCLAERILSIIVLLILCAILIKITATKTIEKYRKSATDPMLFEIKKRMEPLFQGEPLTGNLAGLNRNKLNSIQIKEDNQESYTINKKDIYMCLYDEKGRYYHINNLLYVFGHELAHTLCPEEGHGKHWETIFTELLTEMTKRGIYDPNIPMIENYCGLNNLKDENS